MAAKNSTIQFICIAVMGLCLFASGVLSTAITAEAGRAQLVYTDQAQEGDPPEVALGIAMGAFRGLFVNYLWLRANKLKEEGKFYEAIELSSAITRLQPRFPRVWAFHAWNMAYNISVATQTSEERWQWVKAGVDLLRREAIPRNPNDVLLHKELAWIFNHKIQSFSDDANRFYKRRMAQDWAFILGQPPALPEDNDEATKAMAAWLQPVANAADRLEDVIAHEIDEQKKKLRPGDDASAITSKVAELVEKLTKEGGLKLDQDLLRFVTLHDAYKSSWYADSKVIVLTDQSKNPIVEKYRDDPQYADAWNRLLPHVRRRVLIDQNNMEPDRMVRYTLKYGPLDWRHASSHAIYWATRGVDEALERQGDHQFDTLNTDRIVVQGLQELFRSGKIFYDPVTDSYTALLDTHWTDAYGNVFEELAARGGVAEKQDRAYTLYGAGYENFLRDVIRVYYRMGEYAMAEKYYDKLRTGKFLNTNDPDKLNEFQLPLKEFVIKELHNDRLSVPHVAASEAASSLIDAYYNGLLAGNIKRFKSSYEYAYLVHKTYFEEKQTVQTNQDREDRMQEMPRDFADMAAGVFVSLLLGGEMDPPQASRIFQKAPPEIQQLAYETVTTAMLRRGMKDTVVKLLFPEPAGMEQFRQARAEMEANSAAALKAKLQTEKK